MTLNCRIKKDIDDALAALRDAQVCANTVGEVHHARRDALLAIRESVEHLLHHVVEG